MLQIADKRNIQSGLYVYFGADGVWEWAKVVTPSTFEGGAHVEFVDPCGKTDLGAERDGYRDRGFRFKHRAIARFPYDLYGPVEMPITPESRRHADVAQANRQLGG